MEILDLKSRVWLINTTRMNWKTGAAVIPFGVATLFFITVININTCNVGLILPVLSIFDHPGAHEAQLFTPIVKRLWELSPLVCPGPWSLLWPQLRILIHVSIWLWKGENSWSAQQRYFLSQKTKTSFLSSNRRCWNSWTQLIVKEKRIRFYSVKNLLFWWKWYIIIIILLLQKHFHFLYLF